MNARIDVHSHYLPTVYRAALSAAGIEHPDGIGAIPDWTETAHLAAMERLGVTKAYLSISSPGVYFGDEAEAATLSRAVNEEAVALRERNPGRFGFFASVPLPDADAAERELEYALDTLNADGLAVKTNTAGIYLGDERMHGLYAQLDARRSTLFIHPTTAHRGEHLGLGYPRPMLEYFFETTRSVADLIISGALDRFPNMRVIVPHAGAALPVLANRIDLLLPLLTQREGPGMRAALHRLHFDVAGAPVPELLSSLLAVADPARLHYGSDYPFTPVHLAAQLTEALDATPLLTPDARAAIYSANTHALFDRPALEG